MTRLARWRGPAALVTALLGGIVLGATGAVVQAGATRVGSVDLPWGIPLVLAVLAVSVRGACWWVGTRLGGCAVAAGWLVASLVLATRGPGGDLLLPDDLGPRVYLIGGALLTVAMLLPGLPTEPDRGQPGVPPSQPATDPDPSAQPPAGR